MAVADKQVWVLAKPRISDETNQMWVLGQAWCVRDVTAAAGASHTKVLSDTVTIGDAISKGFGSIRADTVAVADALGNAPGLIEADNVALSDALVIKRFKSRWIVLP